MDKNYNIITDENLSLIQGGGPTRIVAQCIGGAILAVWGGPKGMFVGCIGGVVEAVFN